MLGSRNFDLFPVIGLNFSTVLTSSTIRNIPIPHHPFTHEQAMPSGDFLEKNHENLS